MPLDYVLFAIIIPVRVGSILGNILQRLGIVGDGFGFLIMVLSVISAALYIQVCEKIDKEP